jgi:hypothetical protein
MQLSTTSPHISYGGCLLRPIFCAARSATNPNVGPSYVGWRPSIGVLSHELASLFLTSSQLSKPYRLSLQSILLPEEDSEARKGVRRVSPDLDVTKVASAVSSSLPLVSHTVRHLLIPCTRKEAQCLQFLFFASFLFEHTGGSRVASEHSNPPRRPNQEAILVSRERGKKAGPSNPPSFRRVWPSGLGRSSFGVSNAKLTHNPH